MVRGREKVGASPALDQWQAITALQAAVVLASLARDWYEHRRLSSPDCDCRCGALIRRKGGNGYRTDAR